MRTTTPLVRERSSSHAAGRGAVFILCGLLALVAPATADAGWPDGADRPSSSQRPPDAGDAAAKRGTSDSLGDTFGTGTPQLDATSLDVGAFGDGLVISMTFAGTVSAPDSGEADAVNGFIDIDADQDGATGDVSWTEFLTGASPGLGNEFYVDLFAYSAVDGAADLVDDLTEEVVGRVPVAFGTYSLKVGIPLASLDGDGSVNVAAVVGTFAEPTDIVPNSGSVAGPDPTAALLNNDRFRVTVDWQGFDNPGGAALVSELGTGDSALFYFLAADNLEFLVKVLDGCDFNDHYWVFYAAATDVGFTLTVTDTLTGAEKQYDNALGNLGGGINDTFAFATCP